MKFKKTEENYLVYSLKNMRISNKKRRHIQKNIQIGAKLLATPNNENLNKITYNYKPYYRPISLNVSRYRRLSAQEGADNCSPTRAYHSDSETVVRKEKESSYRSQKNLFTENEINFTCIPQNDNNISTPLNTEQSGYLSSESSSYRPIKEDCCGISHDIYHTSAITNNHPEIAMKRFSLRESSTSLFGSNLIDLSKSTSLERSPSLQHIGNCSSIDASPCFRTPMSTISGNCDQLTATASTSSRVSCSSGYSHSGIFTINNTTTGYSSDDFHLLQYQRNVTNENNNNNNHSLSSIKRDQWITSAENNNTNNNNRNIQINNCLSNEQQLQPHILSLGVDLPRQPNIMSNSGDSSSGGMEDLSAYMDLMIHIPKMHL